MQPYRNLLFISIFIILASAVKAQQPVIIRTKAAIVKGTVFLVQGDSLQSILTSNGFDVALAYNASPANLAKAYHIIKTSHSTRGNRFDVAGVNNGANLAAQLLQWLDVKEQPNNALLLSPTLNNETVPGTVFPLIMPPVTPLTVLYTNAKTEYTKTFVGYDGTVVLDSNKTTLLAAFAKGAAPAQHTLVNPAAVAVKGYSEKRHEEKLALVANHKYDLVMLGNSITNNFEKAGYQPIWNQFFAPRNAVNLGFSGYRTENIIWNIEHGELNGQSPKVLVLEIGTNNIDEKNYPTRHTAGQLAGGIKAIVDLVRQKLPDTKIMVLRCFPGCYGGPNPTSHRAILERASDLVSKFADNKHIFYCDVNHVFINFDGSINQDMMPDWLHPSPAGALAWAKAMEPMLSQLMGDSSLDTGKPGNTAIIPVTKLEDDSYNWWDRHAEVLRIKDSINPDVVLIGNSITHFWGGLPQLKYADGKLRQPNGPNAWASVFGNRRVLNLGFGWDRTQNALWRLDHGELDGLNPRYVIIDIGTNNTSQTDHARMNTAAEIVEGIQAVCLRVRSKVPHANIIVMNIFPREKDPNNPRRILINDINKQLNAFAAEQRVTLVDIGPKMLAADGTFLPGMMLDYTHPTDKGYQVWADAIRPLIGAGD